MTVQHTFKTSDTITKSIIRIMDAMNKRSLSVTELTIEYVESFEQNAHLLTSAEKARISNEIIQLIESNKKRYNSLHKTLRAGNTVKVYHSQLSKYKHDSLEYFMKQEKYIVKLLERITTDYQTHIASSI